MAPPPAILAPAVAPQLPSPPVAAVPPRSPGRRGRSVSDMVSSAVPLGVRSHPIPLPSTHAGSGFSHDFPSVSDLRVSSVVESRPFIDDNVFGFNLDSPTPKDARRRSSLPPGALVMGGGSGTGFGSGPVLSSAAGGRYDVSSAASSASTSSSVALAASTSPSTRAGPIPVPPLAASAGSPYSSGPSSVPGGSGGAGGGGVATRLRHSSITSSGSSGLSSRSDGDSGSSSSSSDDDSSDDDEEDDGDGPGGVLYAMRSAALSTGGSGGQGSGRGSGIAAGLGAGSGAGSSAGAGAGGGASAGAGAGVGIGFGRGPLPGVGVVGSSGSAGSSGSLQGHSPSKARGSLGAPPPPPVVSALAGPPLHLPGSNAPFVPPHEMVEHGVFSLGVQRYFRARPKDL